MRTMLTGLHGLGLAPTVGEAGLGEPGAGGGEAEFRIFLQFERDVPSF